MKKISSVILGLSLTFLTITAKSQLTINSGATFNIQSGALVVVQGDVTASSDIIGTGSLSLKGAAIQNINMNGFALPNLIIDNSANTNATGNLKINNSVTFTNGKIILGNNTVTLAAAETNSTMATGKFFETNGTGVVKKELSTDISNYIIPVGLGIDYMPVSITNTGSTYNSASISTQVNGTASANKHPRTESYLLNRWPITKTGITGGTTNAVATYIDPTKVIGAKADLKGFYWDGTNWSLTGGNQNSISNTAGADITTNTGELYAMNKFVLLNTKIFLQAAYNPLTPGLMDDKLRTTVAYIAGNAPTGNLLPSSDPYRTADYSTNFVHVANSISETVTNTSVFNDQINPVKNIVDWIFLELRSNVATPTTVLQTRSGLLLRDGSVVDVDGVSPIYFKNTDPANTLNLYVAARHRNHIGLRSLNTKTLDILSVPPTLDLTLNANTLGGFGANLALGVNGLYAGNINQNTNVRVSGASVALSDFEQLKSLLGTSLILSNNYSAADANMNRTVRISGASVVLSDFEYIKSILGTSLIVTQPTF
jgi:hypothetical protein